MQVLTREQSKELLRKSTITYETKLRAIVDTPENLGKLIVFDAETGDYEIGSDPAFQESAILQARHPGVPLMTFRIGYKSVETFGGIRERDI